MESLVNLFKKFFLIGLSVFSLAALAQIPEGLTSDWVEIAKTQDQKSIFYVHSKTIERNGDIVKAWVARVSLDDNSSAKNLQEINCKAKQLRYLSIVAYKNSTFSGKSASSDNPTSWDHIVPDSVADNQMDVLCIFTSKRK
jgi:endo-1,4-beta-D-glucanase Y